MTVRAGMLLGIDGGGSSTKWALFSADGAVLRQGRLPAMTGHLFGPDDEAALRSQLAELADMLESRPGAVVAGISGLQEHAEPIFRAALADTFGLPERMIHVVDDLQLAYAAHFAPGDGVMVYAGTGSVASFYTQGGKVLRAGGHGFLLGDEGGAFWQGRQALRAVLHAQDGGCPQPETLARELSPLIGGLDWPQVRAWVYGGGRGVVATLAPAVNRAALAGDAVAQTVMRQAGQALADLALTLQKRMASEHQLVSEYQPSSLPVVLCGGAANDLVRAAFVAALPGVVQVAPCAPVLGAVRLSPLRRSSSFPEGVPR